MRAPALEHPAIELLVTRTVETDHGQVLDVAAQAAGDILKIFLYRSIDIDRAAARRADDDLVHVDVRCIEQAAAFGRRQHRDRVVRPERTQICALERIDGDIDLGKFGSSLVRKDSAAEFLADVEHRSLVAFAFADDDAAAHRDRVHDLAHCLDRDVVGMFAVALAHRLGRFDRRSLALRAENPVTVRVQL